MHGTEIVSDTDIKGLLWEAGVAGDTQMALLCRKALAGDSAARAECARVIQENVDMED